MFEQDKAIHFLVCYVLTQVIHQYLSIIPTVLIVLFLALVVKGLIYDKLLGKGVCDVKDGLADIVGVILGII